MDQVGAARAGHQGRVGRARTPRRLGDDIAARARRWRGAGRPGPGAREPAGRSPRGEGGGRRAGARPPRREAPATAPAAERRSRRSLDLLTAARAARSSLVGPAMARGRAAPRSRRSVAATGHSRAPDGEPARRQRSVAAPGRADCSPRPTPSCSSASAWTSRVRFGEPAAFAAELPLIQVDCRRRRAGRDGARRARRRRRSRARRRPARRGGRAAGRGRTRAWGEEVTRARARAEPADWAALRGAPTRAHPSAPRLRGAPAAPRPRRHPGRRRRRVRPVGAGRARGAARA